jgi:hypothetical protein
MPAPIGSRNNPHGRPPEPAVVLDRIERDTEKLSRAAERHRQMVVAALLRGEEPPLPEHDLATANLASNLRHLTRIVGALKAAFEQTQPPARRPRQRRTRKSDATEREAVLAELGAFLDAWAPSGEVH